MYIDVRASQSSSTSSPVVVARRRVASFSFSAASVSSFAALSLTSKPTWSSAASRWRSAFARVASASSARVSEARRNEDTSCSNASFFTSNARRLCPSRRSRPPGSRRSRLEALSFSRCAASSRGLGGCRGPVGSPCHPEGSGAWTPSSGANAEKSSSANRGLSTAAIASAPTAMTKERGGKKQADKRRDARRREKNAFFLITMLCSFAREKLESRRSQALKSDDKHLTHFWRDRLRFA